MKEEEFSAAFPEEKGEKLKKTNAKKTKEGAGVYIMPQKKKVNITMIDFLRYFFAHIDATT